MLLVRARIVKFVVLQRATLAASVVLFAACSSKQAANSNVPPSPVPSATPSPSNSVSPAAPVLNAAFTAPSEVDANSPATFDAAASGSSDGSAVDYFWEFGDGSRGGGSRIAHLYATGGSKSVKLTVMGRQGAVATATRVVSVKASVASTASANVEVSVLGTDGAALPAVSVSVVGATGADASNPASTDMMGKAKVKVGVAVPVLLKLSKLGYADGFVPVQVPAATNDEATVQAYLRPRDAPYVLNDAAAGGTARGRDGAAVTLPPNALVDASGAAVKGAIDVTATAIDPTKTGADGFPGKFSGITTDGKVTPIVSYGSVEYVLAKDSKPLQLAVGKRAAIHMPVYATQNADRSKVSVGDTKPLWSLDETTGTWIQEGSGTVVADSTSPTGLALDAMVSHLSWWNTDFGIDPYGPTADCEKATDIGLPGANENFANGTICNVFAEFDRNKPGPGRDASIDPRIVGYQENIVLATGGNTPIQVPPNVPIRLTASALKGTWSGSIVITGAPGAQKKEIIQLRPVAPVDATTLDLGNIDAQLPLNELRTLQAGQTVKYSFTAKRDQFAMVTLTTVPKGVMALTVEGRVSLKNGSTVLRTANFSSAQATTFSLWPDSDGTYQLEVTPTAYAPGDYRLQIDRADASTRTATLNYPLEVPVKSAPPLPLPAKTTYRGTFTVDAPATVLVTAPVLLNTQIRVFAPGGALVGTLNPGNSQAVYFTLPARGDYELVARPVLRGDAGQFSLSSERVRWLPVATIPTNRSTAFNAFGGRTEGFFDRNGKIVAAVSDQNQTRLSVRLYRSTGTAWEELGAPGLTIQRTCGPGAFTVAFDKSNAPIIVAALAPDPKTPPDPKTQAVVVQKFNSATNKWEPLGGGDGLIANPANLPDPTDSCMGAKPSATFASDKDLVVAYTFGSKTTLVRRWDGSKWGPATTDAADNFGQIDSGAVLSTAGDGTVYLTLAGVKNIGGLAEVKRLNLDNSWSPVGGNEGKLSETLSCGLQAPRSASQPAGPPVLGFKANVGTCDSSSPGVAAYRFDGTAWSTTGGYSAVGNNTPSTVLDYDSPSVEVFKGQTYAAWIASRTGSTRPEFILTHGMLVQTNSPLGWSPVGEGVGELPESRLGIFTQPYLHAQDGALYLVAEKALQFGLNPQQLVLFKLVD